MDFSKVRNYFLILSLAVVSVLFFYVIKPFIYPIFWAAVIATIFYPIYQRFHLFFDKKHENVSSLLTLLIVIVVILLPLTLISTLVVRESITIFQSISSGKLTEVFEQSVNFLKHNALFARMNIDEAVITRQLTEIGQSLTTFLYNTALKFTQNSLQFLALFVLMLYTLFFFLRDGEEILKKIIHLFPLDDKYEKMLFKKFTSTTSATIKGNFAVAAIQGTLGGILFWATGVPSPLILGILMAAVALIPVGGTFLVWLPVGLGMFFTGNTNQGIIIIIIGVLVISTIDNLIRPMLVGKNLRMHEVIVLFTTLGGVALFGISGFVIGPVIAALFQSFWEIYEDYYHNELENS